MPLMWEWRFAVLGHCLHRSPMLGIRRDNWMLLMNPDRSRVELYDVPRDPMQLENLARRHPDRTEALADEVLAWQSTLPRGPVEKKAGSNAYPWPSSSRLRNPG